MELSANTLKVLHARYLLKDEQGQVCETPAEMFGRIARIIAASRPLYHPVLHTAYEYRF
jgi:ribonucleoside-diphosphate reductase alpha chain